MHGTTSSQPDAKQFKFVRHKGNYVRPLTHSLNLCASLPKFWG